MFQLFVISIDTFGEIYTLEEFEIRFATLSLKL